MPDLTEMPEWIWGYVCLSCERDVNPDAEPSPGEPRYCGDCWGDREREAA